MRNPPKGSAMWNFMGKNRKVIIPHLSWIVNSGDNTLFQSDSWNGFPSISSVCNIPREKQILEEMWESKVKNYFIVHEHDGLPMLTQKDLSIIPILLENKMMNKVIQQRPQ